MKVQINLDQNEVLQSCLHESGHVVMANSVGIPIMSSEVFNQAETELDIKTRLDVGESITLSSGSIDTGRTVLGVTGGDARHFIAVLFAGLLAETHLKLSFAEWQEDYATWSDDAQKIKKCCLECGIDDKTLEVIFNTAKQVLRQEWTSVLETALSLYQYGRLDFGQVIELPLLEAMVLETV